MLGFCKFLHEEKKLVKQSHIIPNFFLKDLILESNEKNIVTLNGKRKKPIQTLYFEKYILSYEAESFFSKLETYAKDFFTNFNYPLFKCTNGEFNGGYQITNADYKKLKAFFISIIWRSSISNREEFCDIKLGKLEEVARSFLLDYFNDNYIETKIFDLLIIKLNKINNTKYPTLNKFISTPFKIKHNDVNFLCLFLGGFQIDIKCDSRKMPNHLRELVVKDNNFLVLDKEFENSKEFKQLKVISKRIIKNEYIKFK
jgi:hypothetical protein